MGLFFPSEIRFDPLLARQLEQLKAQGMRGITNSDQEFVKQVASVLAEIAQASLDVESYFREQGENPVTAFVSAYLSGIVQTAVSKRLDDVGMEGADYLRDVCKGLIQRGYSLNAITHIEYLEQLATLALLQSNDVVLNIATRAMSDCLMFNCFRGFRGSHITDHLVKSLFHVSTMRLKSPLGLDMNKVSYSIGPFVSETERSSLAAINVALTNSIAKVTQANDWQESSRMRSSFEGLHEHLWLRLADLGVAAVKEDSFLLHYINSTIERMIEGHFWLLPRIDAPAIEATDLDSAREQSGRARFQDRVRELILWETTGIYSRIIPAMFEHQHFNYLDDTLKKQCRFAYWSIDSGLLNIGSDALDRVSKVCDRLLIEGALRNPYEVARKAVYIAKIGVYAITGNAVEIAEKALQRYREIRNRFIELHPDLSFVGDFDSHERDLRTPGQFLIVEPADAHFYSKISQQDIRHFFELLES